MVCAVAETTSSRLLTLLSLLQARRDWRGRIGVVSQGEVAAQELTVREMLDHFAGYHATPRPTDELISAVGLAEKARTRTSPASRRRTPSRISIVVVFPAPLGPSRAKTSPW